MKGLYERRERACLTPFRRRAELTELGARHAAAMEVVQQENGFYRTVLDARGVSAEEVRDTMWPCGLSLVRADLATLLSRRCPVCCEWTAPRRFLCRDLSAAGELDAHSQRPVLWVL